MFYKTILLIITVATKYKLPLTVFFITCTLTFSSLFSSIPTYASSPYDSGYDHGCDDAGISDSSDRYINQPEKGPSYHTDEFMSGYYAGVAACSGNSSDVPESRNLGTQQPLQNDNTSPPAFDLVQFCNEVRNGDYIAAEALLHLAGLSAIDAGVRGGCQVVDFLEWLDTQN